MPAKPVIPRKMDEELGRSSYDCSLLRSYYKKDHLRTQLADFQLE